MFKTRSTLFLFVAAAAVLSGCSSVPRVEVGKLDEGVYQVESTQPAAVAQASEQLCKDGFTVVKTMLVLGGGRPMCTESSGYIGAPRQCIRPAPRHVSVVACAPPKYEMPVLPEQPRLAPLPAEDLLQRWSSV